MSGESDLYVKVGQAPHGLGFVELCVAVECKMRITGIPAPAYIRVPLTVLEFWSCSRVTLGECSYRSGISHSLSLVALVAVSFRTGE